MVVFDQRNRRHHARHRTRRSKIELDHLAVGDMRTNDQALELTIVTDIDRIFRFSRHLVTGLDAGRQILCAIKATAAGFPYCAQDIVIGAAAAEMTRQGRAGLFARRNGIAFGLSPIVVKGRGLDNEARRAEATLQGIQRHERPLHRMQPCTADPLDGGDVAACNRFRRHQTAHDGDAVEQYSAGTADACAADELGPGQIHPVADDIDEERFGIVGQGLKAAVDRHGAHRALLLLLIWEPAGATAPATRSRIILSSSPKVDAFRRRSLKPRMAI